MKYLMMATAVSAVRMDGQDEIAALRARNDELEQRNQLHKEQFDQAQDSFVLALSTFRTSSSN